MEPKQENSSMLLELPTADSRGGTSSPGATP